MTSTARRLPADWQWVELGSLFEEDRMQVQAGEADFDSLPFMGLENIESHTRRFISESPAKAESTCFRFDQNHVLYGKLRPYLDKVFLPDSTGKCCMEILPLKPAAGVSRTFLAAILQSKHVIDCAVKYSTGGRMPRADLRKLKRLHVPVPRDEVARESLATEVDRKLSKVESMRQAAARQADAVQAMTRARIRAFFPTTNGNEHIGWQWLPFKKAFNANKGGARKPKIAAKDYLTSGAYPVVDQGKRLVGGHTDCHAAVYETQEPVIVFGDHTKAFKYVDFPHALGADGTQTLHPVSDVVFPRYAYYAAMSVTLPDDGYNRHFKYLKACSLPVPNTIDEQKAFADRLDMEMLAIARIQGASDRQTDAIAAMPGAILREAFDFCEN